MCVYVCTRSAFSFRFESATSKFAKQLEYNACVYIWYVLRVRTVYM